MMTWPYRTNRARPSGSRRVLHRTQEGLGLKLDRLSGKATGTGSQYLGQGIVDVLGLTKPHVLVRPSMASRS